MTCEICGRKIHGLPYHVSIDGAKLIVCSKCATFSSSSQLRPPKPKLNKRHNNPPSSESRTFYTRRVDELELVDDYGKRIKEAREKLGFSQKELGKLIREKVSFLQRIETHKTVPDTRFAKKLEKSLNIVLLAQPVSSQPTENYVVKKPPELTLGDIVNFKKKSKYPEVENERER